MDGANACLGCTVVSGLLFLQKTAKHGVGAVKQRRSAANQCILAKNAQKMQKGTGGSVFGPHRRERIVFLGKFGDARLGRLKKGLGRNKKSISRKKSANLGEAKMCLDRTGAGGSLFLRSYGTQRNSAGTYIESEGQAYVKD